MPDMQDSPQVHANIQTGLVCQLLFLVSVRQTVKLDPPPAVPLHSHARISNAVQVFSAPI